MYYHFKSVHKGTFESQLKQRIFLGQLSYFANQVDDDILFFALMQIFKHFLYNNCHILCICNSVKKFQSLVRERKIVLENYTITPISTINVFRIS